ncbi:MAG TPA: hypothetical protein VK509_01610 [Polyangiales bacterium]|nr:hypothetical protein [Polyangiales bacterium]
MPEMPEDLDIVVTGFEVERGRAEAGLMRVFGLDSQRARRFIEQLPVVAKRCSERNAAERYANALRSIGARIELRPHVEPHGAGDRTSLPAPAGSDTSDSSRRTASERTIARFRASEGLDDLKVTPSGLDLYNPVIPKTPPLPHDLRQMPNGPRSAAPERSRRPSGPSSDQPEWMVSDPLQLTPESDGNIAPSLRSSDSVPTRSSSRSSNPAGRSGERLSDRPRAVGLAHSARATGRPGLSAQKFSLGSSLTPIRRRVARGIAIVMGIVAALLIWLRATGQLLSEGERQERDWRANGIEAGEHAPAREWLSQDDHRVRGLDRAMLDQLIEKLDRAGAPPVHAIGIQPAEDGGEQASALLVEMPPDTAARRTILWHLSAARGQPDAPLLDEGAPFQVLQFR